MTILVIIVTGFVKDIKADEQKCRNYVENSTSVATALVSVIGYTKASELAVQSKEENKTIRQLVLEQNIMSTEKFDELISPESVNRLGFRKKN